MWIAREKDIILKNGEIIRGELRLFVHNRPYKNLKEQWVGDNANVVLSKLSFPNVTFENSPVEVNLMIKENVMYMARSKEGTLYCFKEKPFYEDGLDPVTKRPLDFWNSRNGREIIQGTFSEITFENSPVEVFFNFS